MSPAPCIGDSGSWSLGIVEQSKGEDLGPGPPGKTQWFGQLPGITNSVGKR